MIPTKSKAILRAIDIMDEYSQKCAENMEVATESVVSAGTGLASSIGGGIGVLALLAKKGRKYIKTHQSDFATGGPLLVAFYVGGGILSSLAGFPLFSWAAKKEIEASRRGRFDAMQKELNDPRVFAILTPEQEKELNEKTKLMPTPKKSVKEKLKFTESVNVIKNLSGETSEYNSRRASFEKSLETESAISKEELTQDEIENAKADQQLLTKLIEKIDIASQDYAENAELATSTLIAIVFGAGSLLSLGYDKLAAKLRLGHTLAPKIISALAILSAMIFSASIQKEASRVGRFKVKQDLLKHPEKLVYVSDDETTEIKDIEVIQEKKLNIFRFLKDAWKNDREFKKWKKTEGEAEKAALKALSDINITDEQLKDAKRLQRNTFKTFNKIFRGH